MADKPVFNRKNIKEQQQEQIEQMEKNTDELRKAVGRVAETEDGEKLLRYMFILSGGDVQSVRRDKDGFISQEETLLVLGARGLYENIRFNLASDMVQKIERHHWEK